MGCDEAAAAADAEEAATVGSQLLRDRACISASLDVNVVPTACAGGPVCWWCTVFVSHHRDPLALF